MATAYPTPPAPSSGPSASLWRLPDYRAWFASDTLADLGSSLRAFALPLIAFAATRSLTEAGLVGTVGSLCANLALLPAGVLVDRLPRRELQMRCCALKSAIWAVAALAWWAGALSLPVLLVVSALSGATAGVSGLASNAMMKHVVPEDRYGSAQAANQAREAAFQVAVNPVAGALMALSTGVPLLAEALGQALAVVALRGVHADTSPSRGRAKAAATTVPRAFLAEAAEGVRWLAENRTVLVLVLAFGATSVALTGVDTALTLAWAHEGLSSARIGALTAPAGIGMLVGAAVSPWFLERVRGGMLLAASLSTCVATVGAMTVMTAPWARSALLLVTCLAVPVANAVGSGFTMKQIPSEVFGRVGAALQLINLGPAALAPVLTGAGLDSIGTAPTLAVLAAVSGAGAVALMSSPTVRRLGLPRQW